MRHIFRGVLIFLVLTCSTGIYSDLLAQSDNCSEKRPSTEVLERIKNAGRWLALYDIICENSKAALQNKGMEETPSSCLAFRTENGWSATYGNWDQTAQVYHQTALVKLNKAREVTSVQVHHTLLQKGPAFEYGRAAFLGYKEVEDQLEKSRYEYRILVASYPGDDILRTYIMPVINESNILGGDFRVRVRSGSGQIMSSHRLHNEVLDFSEAPGNTRASISTAVITCYPTETDVFMVLKRPSRLPHLVVASEWIYSISSTGEVQVLRRRKK